MWVVKRNLRSLNQAHFPSSPAKNVKEHHDTTRAIPQKCYSRTVGKTQTQDSQTLTNQDSLVFSSFNRSIHRPGKASNPSFLLTSSIGAFTLRLLVRIWLNPNALAFLIASSLSASAIPRPRWLGLTAVNKLSTCPRSRDNTLIPIQELPSNAKKIRSGLAFGLFCT